MSSDTGALLPLPPRRIAKLEDLCDELCGCVKSFQLGYDCEEKCIVVYDPVISRGLNNGTDNVMLSTGSNTVFDGPYTFEITKLYDELGMFSGGGFQVPPGCGGYYNIRWGTNLYRRSDGSVVQMSAEILWNNAAVSGGIKLINQYTYWSEQFEICLAVGDTLTMMLSNIDADPVDGLYPEFRYMNLGYEWLGCCPEAE